MKRIFLVLLLLISLCGCSDGVETSNVLGVETYVFEGFNMPKDLGKPVLKKTQIEELKDSDINTIINSVDSYIDLLRIVDVQSYVEKFTVEEVYNWAKAKYEQAGFLNTSYINENNKLIYGKIVYVLKNGSYYLLDYMNDFSRKEYFKYYTCDSAVIDSLEQLEKTVAANHPTRFYESHLIKPEDVIVFDNGEISFLTLNRGTDCYYYYGMYVPYGLGTPKLTQKEIIGLTKSEDYELIRNSISNIGDALAFIKELGIRTQGDNEHLYFKGGCGADYGNIFYDSEPGIANALSAAQIIKLRAAQCTAMATVINFLLFDDYEELAYVLICGSDGHAINYLKGFDERYYLVDASLFIDSGTKPWLYHLSLDGNADTLDELMNELKDSIPPWGNDEITRCFSWEFDGVWSYKASFLENGASEKTTLTLPENSYNVHCFKGIDEVDYYKPVNPKDHYYFLDLSKGI